MCLCVFHILVEAPPIEPVPTIEVPVEEKVEEKKKETPAKNKRKGKPVEIEAPPVVRIENVSILH
jgi:hypothetical protein